jgi:YesN/AraC family two-component response regulator
MIFYDNISAGELSNICRNVKPFISFERYVVFCIGNNEEDFSFTERNKYYYFQGNDGLNFIIADEKYKDEVIKKLHKYYIGVSRTYTILYDLKQACCEAVSMRKTAFVKCKPIVEAESFDEPKPMEQYKLKTMLKTTNLICSNNIREALDNIESFAKAIEDGKYSVDEFQEQMNIIIQSVMKIHMSYLKNKESEVREILDMFSFQTIHEYMNMLRTWLNNFDEIISRAEDDDKTGIKMQKAIDYIRENYATDLNMAVVSNHISMNYSLFSFTFKQYTGTNFVNYLKNIRVGQAKKLLTETDMKVNEISKAVGYDHEKHFMKTFKSITGLTPSQYRNNMN